MRHALRNFRHCRPGMGFHVLTRRNIGLGQPIHWDVAAPGISVLTQIARDIGKLEGKAKIIGAAQRIGVVRANAQQARHHQADYACNMIAVGQQVRFIARRKTCRIHCKALDKVARPLVRNAAFGDDQRQRVKSRHAGGFACQCLFRHIPQIGEAFFRVVDRVQCAPMVLPISNIIACPAPAIEQPGSFSRDRIKQFRCQRKRFRTQGNAIARMGGQRCTIKDRRVQRSFAFMAKIV